ncbi:MAG: UDP-glucuronic acid decarboxylase family protein [Thermomicrobiales bacterium]
MHILVTGGAGFIGSHLVDRLLDTAHDVTVVDNFITGDVANLRHRNDHPQLTVHEHDLTHPFPPEMTDRRVDRIFNLASPASPRGYGRYPIETHLANSLGVLNVLEIARRDGARLLQASTSEVYGDPLVHPQREDYWGNVNPVGPRSCYDEGKRFAESLTMEFVRQYGLDARIARIFNTYGPRSKPGDGRVAPNFCVQALRGEPLTIYGDGSQTRSFCFVDDLVSGLIALMASDGLAGEIVNLGNPAEITIREFAGVVLQVTRSSSAIVFEPLPTDDPTRRQPDISKATRLLDWRPTVALEDGLVRMTTYFRATLARPSAQCPVPSAQLSSERH